MTIKDVLLIVFGAVLSIAGGFLSTLFTEHRQTLREERGTLQEIHDLMSRLAGLFDRGQLFPSVAPGGDMSTITNGDDPAESVSLAQLVCWNDGRSDDRRIQADEIIASIHAAARHLRTSANRRIAVSLLDLDLNTVASAFRSDAQEIERNLNPRLWRDFFNGNT